MSPSDIQRIHERFDSLIESFGEVKTDIGILKSKLEPCYKAVMGNGKEGLNTRVNVLEKSDKKRNKWYWLIMGSLVAIVASLASAGMNIFVNNLQ